MNLKLRFKCLYIIIILFIVVKSFPSVVINSASDLSIPSKNSFLLNTKYVRPFKFKTITVAEYITDPLIMYASLWGCFGLTLPLWETNGSVWEPDGYRGFNQLMRTNGDIFLERFKMEPFATGRIDPVTKVYNNNMVFRNDFYAKNIIEPICFTYLTLYMRSKNYHPAILITEIILLAVLYEFTIRPFYMESSFEQLIKNPAIGLAIGLLFDEISDYLLTTPYIGLHVLAYILNPFNALPTSRIHAMLFFEPYRQKFSIEALINLD